MDEKEEAKEKLKRALQALNAPEKQMAELEEPFGLPTDKNLSLGQRLAWNASRSVIGTDHASAISTYLTAILRKKSPM